MNRHSSSHFAALLTAIARRPDAPTHAKTHRCRLPIGPQVQVPRCGSGHGR
jgi:hypothetical protein